LRLSLHKKTDQLWCKKGYELAKDQIVLHGQREPKSYASASNASIAHKETAGQILITGDGFAAAVSKTNGELSSWEVNGVEQLESALRPNFWRPLTDNDTRFRKFPQRGTVWRDLRTALNTNAVGVRSANEKSIEVLVKQSFQNKVKLETKYTIFNDGNIVVKMDLDTDESLPDMPKFGVTMGIPAEYANTAYYGKGPWESYSDRKRGAEVDEFKAKTDRLFNNYAMPQENGNRTETRWVKLTADHSNSGIMVTGLPHFNFSVWPYSFENIDAAKHPYDLKPQGFYTLNIDLAQTGVGGMKVAPMPHQLVQSGRHHFAFMLSPNEHGD
jgi:beta-galactosidase